MHCNGQDIEFTKPVRSRAFPFAVHSTSCLLRLDNEDRPERKFTAFLPELWHLLFESLHFHLHADRQAFSIEQKIEGMISRRRVVRPTLLLKWQYYGPMKCSLGNYAAQPAFGQIAGSGDRLQD